MNLFGEEFGAPQCEAPQCAATKKKPAKKSTSKVKSKLDEALPSRNIQVKMYSDFYLYEAPEDLEKPTLEHVRKWMVNTHGFNELMDVSRAALSVMKPEGQDPFVYCAVRFEKMG